MIPPQSLCSRSPLFIKHFTPDNCIVNSFNYYLLSEVALTTLFEHAPYFALFIFPITYITLKNYINCFYIVLSFFPQRAGIFLAFLKHTPEARIM